MIQHLIFESYIHNLHQSVSFQSISKSETEQFLEKTREILKKQRQCEHIGLFESQIWLFNFQQKQLIIQIEAMGCFPDKPTIKGQALSSERERLIQKFEERNPNNSSVYLPINIKPPRLKNFDTPKSRRSLISSPKKMIATPMKGKRSPKKRYPLSQEKQSDIKVHEGKLVRKQVEGRTVVRKKGTVIELPFRQHLITRIETPSETAQTSLLSNLQKHPSDFFTKFESKLLKNRQSDKPKDVNNNADVGTKSHKSISRQSKLSDNTLFKQR